MGEGGSKERGWRVPRQRFCSSARETETFAVRAGEGERERESAASRENDSRRTNEKGSTMTAKRAHPPRRFDLSVLESLKRRLSFGRDVRITNIYIYIYIPFTIMDGVHSRCRWRIDPSFRTRAYATTDSQGCISNCRAEFERG